MIHEDHDWAEYADALYFLMVSLDLKIGGKGLLILKDMYLF